MLNSWCLLRPLSVDVWWPLELHVCFISWGKMLCCKLIPFWHGTCNIIHILELKEITKFIHFLLNYLFLCICMYLVVFELRSFLPWSIIHGLNLRLSSYNTLMLSWLFVYFSSLILWALFWGFAYIQSDKTESDISKDYGQDLNNIITIWISKHKC